MVAGFDEAWESCDELNFVTRFIKPISHAFTLFFCVYYIGYKKHLFNWTSFWFSVYQVLGIIGGICEVSMCAFVYKDSEDWSVGEEIIDIVGTTVTTCMMSLWWIIILVCFYKSWSKEKTIKTAKIIVLIIIFVILPLQIVFIFVFGHGTGLSNLLRIGGLVGMILQIAIIFVLKSDPNVPAFTSYQLWFVLVWCGAISYLIASVAVFTFGYVWGRVVLYQYFWFVCYWLLYLESLPQTKIFDWSDKTWNSASLELQQQMSSSSA